MKIPIHNMGSLLLAIETRKTLLNLQWQEIKAEIPERTSKIKPLNLIARTLVSEVVLPKVTTILLPGLINIASQYFSNKLLKETGSNLIKKFIGSFLKPNLQADGDDEHEGVSELIEKIKTSLTQH